VSDQRPIVVFDAICPLCSSNAQFILRHDRRGRLRLASMQSEAGTALYRRHGIDPANPETLIVAKGERAIRNSDAVIAIWSELDWPWRLASAARLVPRWIRDPIYLWIARHRYRLFGRRESCWLPDSRYSDRLL
jgi:predicted DCC family thiol-disulfide oxidoreductase YuxK